VDCFHPVNVGKLCIGDTDGFFPCTPYGIVVLLQENDIDVAGRHVVILGRSNIVGKPLANLLVQKRQGANATVTVCHTATRILAELTRQADILVAAMGRPRCVTAAMVKPGAVVVDVGINREADTAAKSGYRLVGDVDFDAVKAVAGAITPVPGGIGPMTITMLLANTVKAAQRRLAH
jgi:methylenetetrahydrofolate dehydrogenase (NADP+)/methenyltetrahydrofolate cyclohydrolase